MKNIEENKKIATQYLYGELSNTERDNLEERLFTDEDFSLFVDEVENDLIDEYVRGELLFEEKRKFEKKYLTTESRFERVAVARTLQNELFNEEKVVSTEESKGFWESLAGLFRLPNLALAGGLGAILLMLLLGGVWIATQPKSGENIVNKEDSNLKENIPVQIEPTPEFTPEPEKSPSEVTQENTNKSEELDKKAVDTNKESVSKNPDVNKSKPKPTPKPVEKEPKTVKKPKPVRPQPKVFAFSLLPPLRSSTTPVLKIPSTAKTVRLRLLDNFGDKYEKFIIDLNNGGGSTIWSRELKASKKRPQKSISISISSDKFQKGNQEIAVKGITKEGEVEEINYYNFTVEKK